MNDGIYWNAFGVGDYTASYLTYKGFQQAVSYANVCEIQQIEAQRGAASCLDKAITAMQEADSEYIGMAEDIRGQLQEAAGGQSGSV